MTRQRANGRFAHSPDMRPEWREYWDDPSVPHPDVIGAQNGAPLGERPNREGQGYCHHYRMVNEHYHRSMEELEACEQ